MRTLGAVLVLALALPVAASAQQPQEERGITTNGAAVLSARQDIARFSFGVSAQRLKPSAAQRFASRRITRVILAVRQAGVASADVRTQSIRLVRRTRRLKNGRTRLLGYRASQSVRVTVRKLSISSSVVDAAVKSGATNVSGPDFGLSNRAQLYREALKLALRDARDKAQALADEAGLTLGRAIRIVEEGREFTGAGGADDVDRLPPSSPGQTTDEEVPTPVRPGEEDVEATLSVTFETS